MSELIKGRLYKGLNGLYTVVADGVEYQCRAASRIRKEDGIKLLAGDDVKFALNDDGTGFIEQVLERKNSFIRPSVANVDVIVIVVAAAKPEPSMLGIDKLCCIAESKNVQIMIVFTKNDLGDTRFLTETYQKTPYPYFVVGKDDYQAASEVKDAIKGKFAVLTGASGVGKSTLLNAMFPSLGATTGELSRKIMRGKNTTRVTEIYGIDGCCIADTPGFSMLDYETCLDADKYDLVTLFPEMAMHLGECRYTKCSHTKEDDCAIIKAVKSGQIAQSRHESYCAMYDVAKTVTHY